MIIKDKKRRRIPQYAAHQKKHLAENRLELYLEYSIRQSNSDIPCCRCCGQNSHTDFLEVDHIQGKKEMESIPELMKLGYSSTLDSQHLVNWIIRNNFLRDLQTEYFQILCCNCNKTKGMAKNNNECPMKGKPH